MILSHRAQSSLNMSSYRAIWTNFTPNFIFLEQKIPDPGPKIPDRVHKIVFTGGLPPPRPPALGGLQPLRPPGRGLAPLHTERLRLSGSPFFLGTKILEAPNLWCVAAGFFFPRKMTPIFLEAPNLGAGP